MKVKIAELNDRNDLLQDRLEIQKKNVKEDGAKLSEIIQDDHDRSQHSQTQAHEQIVKLKQDLATVTAKRDQFEEELAMYEN